MKNSSIEITDQDYLIKLSREDFNICFINRLVKLIQAEQFFFSYETEKEQEDLVCRSVNMDLNTRFDNLRDK